MNFPEKVNGSLFNSTAACCNWQSSGGFFKVVGIATCIMVLWIIFLCFVATPLLALDIIPGLKGFGTQTRAAYGARNTPEICIVDDLTANSGNPDWNSSGYSVGVFKGSLNQCIEGLDTQKGETIAGHVVAANSGKIILFEVSGTIRQTGKNGANDTFQYRVGSYTTIAGQTSPAPGILLRNISIVIADKHDILVQHIRGRLDGPPSTTFGNHKVFLASTPDGGSLYNIVFDHISAAWGADAQFEIWGQPNSTVRDITISNSIMGPARINMGLLNLDSIEGKVSQFATASSSTNLYNLLSYGNLYLGGAFRTPAIKNGAGLWVNNYSYNNQIIAYSVRGTKGFLTVGAVNNVVAGGPMSSPYAGDYFPNLGFAADSWVLPLSKHRIYLYGNMTDTGIQSSSGDWSRVDDRTRLHLETSCKVTGETPSSDSPIWPAGLSYIGARDVQRRIVANAGAYPAFRDSLDRRSIEEMVSGTGPFDVASGVPAASDWPVLTENRTKLAIPRNPHRDSGNGYTNLEVWLQKKAREVERNPLDTGGMLLLLLH